MNETEQHCSVVSDEAAVHLPTFREGDLVSVHTNRDGILRRGIVSRVYEAKRVCLVEFGDGTKRWLDWALLMLASAGEESDVVCEICCSGVSQEPDYIVICDRCCKGYHQACHDPAIVDALLEPDISWYCCNCAPDEQAEAGSRSIGCLSSPETSSPKAKCPGLATGGLCQFPYKLDSLRWTEAHLANQQNTYCYCGSRGSWSRQMLQCDTCLQWFHEGCLKHPGRPGELLGCRFDAITCAVCNPDGEIRHRYAYQWTDVALLIIYNLTHPATHAGLQYRRHWVDFFEDIIPFLEQYWSSFHWGPKEYTADERQFSLLKAFLDRDDLYASGRDFNKRMSMFRFRQPHVPAPQPDTKLPRHASPVPYPPDVLPSERHLLRFSLDESDKGRRTKRMSRSLPQQVVPVVRKYSSVETMDSDEASSDGGSAKRVFVKPSAPFKRGKSGLSSSLISASGKLIQIPQRCARKSADTASDFQDGAEFLRLPAQRQAVSVSEKGSAKLQPGSQSAARSQSSSAAVSSGGGARPNTTIATAKVHAHLPAGLQAGSSGKVSTSDHSTASKYSHGKLSTSKSGAPPTQAATARTSAASLARLAGLTSKLTVSGGGGGGSHAKPPSTSVSRKMDGIITLRPEWRAPVKVLGVRTLATGERQYLIDRTGDG